MGDIISIYEDYKEIMAGDNWTPPTLSNKTIYFYVTPIEKKKCLQSALNRKCIRRRRMKVSTWPPLRTKLQRISNDIVKGNALVTDSDQYIIPANSEVPKVKVKRLYRRKKVNQDKQLALKKNCLLRYNLDFSNMKFFKNIEMPAIPCFWQFMDRYPDIQSLFVGADNRCLLPVKKCYCIELKNLSHNFEKYLAVSCGQFRVMLINSTWRSLAEDSLVQDPYCEGNQLELLKNSDLPFCIVCMVNKDAYVKRDYQSPPRECVGCRLYKDEKGSNDDLVQWAKHSQLIHSQNTEEEYKYDIKSPVSRNSREGIHLKSKPGSGCCSDSEDGHEKRSIPEDRYTFKKRRTDLEGDALKCESPGDFDSREFPPYRERSVSAPGSRVHNDDIPNYKNRFSTKERQGRSLRSPHTNSDRGLAFAADQPQNKPAKRINEIVALREELAMRFKQKDGERKKEIEANRGRWVRETVITALSEGEGDPTEVGIKNNIKNTLVSQVNNNDAVLLATLSALSCNNVQDADDNLTVTTFEKSLHSEETSLGKNRLIKKTVIKIEKNESSAKASVGTHLRIEDRLRISSTSINNKQRHIKSGNNVSVEGDELTNLPILGSAVDAKSNESMTRPSTGKSRSATGGSDCSSLRRLKKNVAKLSRKSSSQHRSANSSTLSTSPVVSKTKMLYRSQVNRKSTLIMDLFADQLKENCSVKSATSTDVTKESNTTLNATPKLDHPQPSGERRALTASTNLKKTRSRSKCRPRSVTNSTSRRTPTARPSNKSLIPRLRSQKNLPRVSSNLQARRIERPPSRKPIHVSPVASSTTEKKISDNNLERTAKNKYTLRKNSLAKRPSLKYSIENSLKINQTKQQSTRASDVNKNDETESKKGTTPGNAFRKNSVSTPATPVKQIKTVKSVPAKIDQISRGQSSNTTPEGNVSRKIPKITPLTRPTSSPPKETKATKSVQPTKAQEPKQPIAEPAKIDKDSDWWKKWNSFSAPNARVGHPLKSMTLAEFQAKRRTKSNGDVDNAPPLFIKSSRVAIMSDTWGNRKSGLANSKPIENGNASVTAKENKIASTTAKENKISEPKQAEKGQISVDNKQSKPPIKDTKQIGQNKNVTDIKVEQPSSKINNLQQNVKEENEKNF